jgi:pyruvate kinase
MVIHTKIVCTIGPAVNTYEKILELIKAGMNVARINFSHGSHAEHGKIIDLLKKAREELKVPLAIMLDTKGPEIRIGKIKEGKTVLKSGQRWRLLKESIEGDDTRVSITPPHILDQVHIGATLLFDDGYITAKVVEKDTSGLSVEILNNGTIGSTKGVNIPDAHLCMPAMTDTDIADIRFGCEKGIDIIAASFICSAEHVLEIKQLLLAEDSEEVLLMAKIESSEGVRNFDSILQVADGIMIARGDLGVEMPLSEVPVLQKKMIRQCYLAGKPAITATQMLESMIHNPRPTRAEASDVANAIYDSTSAVMLSGETAVGKYPLESVQVMKQIIVAAEEAFDYRNFFDHHLDLTYHDVPSVIALASVKVTYNSHAQAIFAFTSKGYTARLLSRLRPSVPILGVTQNKRCYHQMACNWGVIPILGNESTSLPQAFKEVTTYALENDLLEHGDLVVVTSGSPFGVSSTTNMMHMENIGNVLVRSIAGFGKTISGRVTLISSPETVSPKDVKGRIIVIGKCNDSYLSLLQSAIGVILENHIDDTASEQYLMEFAKTCDTSILIRADNAFHVLSPNQQVLLNPKKSIVYA